MSTLPTIPIFNTVAIKSFINTIFGQMKEFLGKLDYLCSMGWVDLHKRSIGLNLFLKRIKPCKICWE